ncbi:MULTISPECIES: acyltransferase family protein [Methylobacterium]|uniref:acyltransferase family protein n=1 Tax=Methylobacterium TaxID=407 RepID=UPI0009E6C180|nr:MULTISPECIES: acyltransferase [Methylobacterium]MCI9882537.1 acyltransferase [Methylobacterium goesingense]
MAAIGLSNANIEALLDPDQGVCRISCVTLSDAPATDLQDVGGLDLSLSVNIPISLQDVGSRARDRPIQASKHAPLYSIQILRCLVASFVIMDHILLYSATEEIYGVNLKSIAWMFGDLGVETFFAISGCLMMVTSQDAFGRRGAPATFIRKRFQRLIPLYWFITALLLFAIVRKHPLPPMNEILASFLFLPVTNALGEVRPVLPQGWTLNYEMLFYLIFAFSLLFAKRTGVIVLCAVFLALFGIGLSQKSLLDTRSASTTLEFCTDPIILTFLGGALAGLLRPMLAARLPATSPALGLALLAAFLLCFVGGLAILTDDSVPRSVFAKWSVHVAAVLAILICLIPHRAPETPVARALNLLGDASFSTYLVHTFAIRWGFMLVGALSIDQAFARILLLLVFANLFGLAVHVVLERPLLRAFRFRPFARRA